jgi:hypothetical protein
MKTVTALMFAAVVLAGCTASGNTTVPRVTAPGTSPISSGKQLAFCQDQVAFMYSVKPQFVTARERVVAADGSTTIDVIIDKGNESAKTYKCRLDASRRFVGVTAATSDGAL